MANYVALVIMLIFPMYFSLFYNTFKIHNFNIPQKSSFNNDFHAQKPDILDSYKCGLGRPVKCFLGELINGYKLKAEEKSITQKRKPRLVKISEGELSGRFKVKI